MKAIYNLAGEVEVKRGESIYRGQQSSKYILVSWLDGQSPTELETGAIPVGKLLVQINITRPDEQQSGWQTML